MIALDDPDARNLNLKTGWLCLDFANTAEFHASQHPQEHLNSYADLVAWANQVGLLTNREREHLRQEAARHPARATAVLEEAILLRETIYRIFAALAHSRPPEAKDLVTLNAKLPDALAHAQLVSTADGFAWDWVGEADALGQMLWPVIRSAATLLTSNQWQRVGQCADDRGCGWLFFDTSRNRSRRWCDMKDCGNRAKVRRHRRRKGREAC